MKKNLFALLVVGLVVGNASAVTLYWDPDASTTVPGNNDVSSGANLGGAGTWNAANLNWWDGGAGVPGDGTEVAWSTSTTNSSVFWGPSSGVVTIPASETRTATGLTFKTDGYEIADAGTTSATNGIITFSVAPNIVVDPNVTAKITARIGATNYANGYNVSGGGRLIIAEPTGVTAAATGGANATLGTVSVTSGTAVNATNFTDGNHTILEVIGGGQIGNSGTVGQYPITLNGGTYRDTDTTPSGTAFAFTTGTSRNWVIGSSGGVWDVPASSAILLNGGATVGAGSVVGNAGSILYKTGAGEIRMAGVAGQTNTVEKLVIAEGRFTIGQASTLGRDDQLGAVPANPGVGAQALTLNGQGSGAILRFVGGTSTTTTTLSVNRGVYLDTTGGSTNTIQTDGSNATIPGLVSGPGGFNKTGVLNLNLSKTDGNTYAGPTNVNAGVLKLISGTTSTGSRVGNGAVTVASGAALSLESDGTTPQPEAPGGVSINGGGNLAGNGILAGTLTVANSGGKVTPGIGNANAVLTVPNADFSSGTSGGGILQTNLGASSTSDVLKVTNVNGLNLGGGTFTLQPIAGATPAGQTFTLIDYNTSYTGTVGSMHLNDLTGIDGTTVFDDVPNHLIKVTVGTGGTIDRTWILESGFGNWNSDTLPGPNDTANWAKPDNTTPATAANGVGAIARFPATVPVGLPNAGNAIQSQTITLSDVNKTVGTMILDNPNSLQFLPGIAGIRLTMQTYTGNALLDVKQGTHTIGTVMTFASPTDVNLANGTTLTITGAIANPGATGANAVTINTAGTSTMTMASLANPGGMTKTGPGSLILTGAISGVGATNINDGLFQFKDNLSGLGDTSTVTIGSTAALDMNSSFATVSGNNQQPTKVNDTIGALAGSGTLKNHGDLTLGGSNASPVTFSGTIDITNATPATARVLTKNGAGVQTISATIAGTGAGAGGLDEARFTSLTVAAGTLRINNATVAQSLVTSGGTTSVSSGATLGGNATMAGPVTIAAGGTFAPGNSIGTFAAGNTGAGSLTMTGIATGTPAALSMELNTVGTSDLSDVVAVAGTLATGTLAVKPRINLVNAGTMTGGAYNGIVTYVAESGNGLALNTVPAGFIAALIDNTANKRYDLVVEFVGDFNNDNVVDAGDYVIARKGQGLTGLGTSGGGFTRGDANNDGSVNQTDLDLWRANYGKSITPSGSGSGLGNQAVPEPAALALVVLGVFFTGMVRRRG